MVKDKSEKKDKKKKEAKEVTEEVEPGTDVDMEDAAIAKVSLIRLHQTGFTVL